jgi:hypothetical protein
MTRTTLGVALISPAIAILIALFGFRRSKRADKLRAFFDLYERYLSVEHRQGRKTIHTRIKGLDHSEIAGLDSSVLSSVGHTLAVMNAIGIACQGGYVDASLVANGMGRSFAHAIEAARPYIDHVESIRGYRPYPFAERLARDLVQHYGILRAQPSPVKPP